MKLFKRYFKKHLTIKTKYNPANYNDVQAFEKACSILEKQGIEFERGSEIVATEIGKKIYFMQCLGDRAIIDDWIMIAQFRLAKDVLDKRNRLIAKGIPKDELAIVRYRSKART